MRMTIRDGNAHDSGDCYPPTCPACEYEHTETPRLYVDEDAAGDEAIWEKAPTPTGQPRVVLYGYDAGDEELWEAVKSLVEAGGVP